MVKNIILLARRRYYYDFNTDDYLDKMLKIFSKRTMIGLISTCHIKIDTRRFYKLINHQTIKGTKSGIVIRNKVLQGNYSNTRIVRKLFENDYEKLLSKSSSYNDYCNLKIFKFIIKISGDYPVLPPITYSLNSKIT